MRLPDWMIDMSFLGVLVSIALAALVIGFSCAGIAIWLLRQLG